MALTIAPADEACAAIVERLNTGFYAESFVASYAIEKSEDLASNGQIQVDVIHEDSDTLDETLDVENRTSHNIRVWIRKQVDLSADSIAEMNLVTRQIFQRLNNFDSSDGRVRIWECDMVQEPDADKAKLREMGLYSASCELRVEVEVS